MIVLIVSAGLLAFVVLYNLTNINITERQKEIATIKVLGFYDKEVSAYIYRETGILTLIGTAIGLIFGIFLHAFVVKLSLIHIFFKASFSERALSPGKLIPSSTTSFHISVISGSCSSANSFITNSIGCIPFFIFPLYANSFCRICPVLPAFCT